MIKGLKRLKGNNDKRTPARAQEPKGSIHTVAPKQIIRALYDYEPQGDDEMKFQQRDFLYVVDDSDPEWYVACNPLLNTSGFVPVSYFELIHRPESIPTVPISSALNKQRESSGSVGNPKTPNGPSAGSHLSAGRLSNGVMDKLKSHGRHGSSVSRQTNNSRSSSHAGDSAVGSRKSSTTLAIYGVMLYDFSAERNDELEAHAGESIVIIAQSNTEWFVAKPIGRLGGPGLVPVSYVEVREVGTDAPLTDIEDAIKRAGVPRVEEWKRRAAEYKATSIPLGRFGSPERSDSPVVVTSPQYDSTEHMRSSHRSSTQRDEKHKSAASSSAHSTQNVGDKTFVGSHVVQAGVDSFAISGGRYWFRLVAKTADGRFRNLCRFYFDFYEFQLKLLDSFPLEAGRAGEPRSLPYMPGPLTIVNHEISASRRAFLDEYVKNLLRMPPHISQSDIMQQFFLPREGDVECDRPTNQMPIAPSINRARQSGASSETQEGADGRSLTSSEEGKVDKYGERTILPDHHQEGLQIEHQYERDFDAPTSSLYSVNSTARSTTNQSWHDPKQSWHDPMRNGSTNTLPNPPSGAQAARSATNLSAKMSQVSLHNHPDLTTGPAQDDSRSFARVNENYMRAEANSINEREETVTPADVPGASANLPAYIKVKVFYGDELIAIRIPSSLSFEDLYARICLRLSLQEPRLYGSQDFTGPIVMTNNEFHQLISSSGKVTLYAKI